VGNGPFCGLKAGRGVSAAGIEELLKLEAGVASCCDVVFGSGGGVGNLAVAPDPPVGFLAEVSRKAVDSADAEGSAGIAEKLKAENAIFGADCAASTSGL